MKFFRLVSDYRWPIYIGGHLTMSVVACGVLVWVATRPDTPRPIQGYYESARAWDADEAVDDASRQLGWTVRYELPADMPHYRGHAAAGGRHASSIATGSPVSGLAGRLFAIRPSDARLNQRGDLVALPAACRAATARSSASTNRARGNSASTPCSRRCASCMPRG